MRRGLALIGCLFVCLQAEPLKITVEGESVLLMNAQSKAILFEKNAYNLSFPASTTKVATALYALKLKQEELNTPIEAEAESLATIKPEVKRNANYTRPAYWLESDGTHIGIKKGEILTLRDLLNGMLIVSGNDAANVIAQAVGPSIPSFMEGLNRYLHELGCEQTLFCNPHGLHHPQHQTTAYDLALITREALKFPVFREIVSQVRFIRPKTNKQAATTLLQSNRLLRAGKLYYAKAIGVKTGYHSKAKNTFIAAAQSGDRTLIAVLLGYQERQAIFQDAVKLFEAAFNQPRVQRSFLKAGPQSFSQLLPKAAQPLQTYLQESVSVEYYPAEDPLAKCLLYWRELTLPIKKEQQVGEIQLVSAQGERLKTVPLWAVNDVALRWPYNWTAYLSGLSWIKWIGGLVGLSIILLGSLFYLFKRST